MTQSATTDMISAPPENEDKMLGATAFLRAMLADLESGNGGRAAPADSDGVESRTHATLGDVADRLDERAFGLMLLLLALPCCLPFVYGLPQIVALPMLALAGQMALGRDSPWLPSGLASRRFEIAGFRSVLDRAQRYLGWIENIARPRFAKVTSPLAVRITGALLLVPCASILVPLPGTNTAPGIGVAVAAVGMIERDGLLIAIGLVIGFLWVAALLIFGAEAASALKDAVAARL